MHVYEPLCSRYHWCSSAGSVLDSKSAPKQKFNFYLQNVKLKINRLWNQQLLYHKISALIHYIIWKGRWALFNIFTTSQFEICPCFVDDAISVVCVSVFMLIRCSSRKKWNEKCKWYMGCSHCTQHTSISVQFNNIAYRVEYTKGCKG